MRVAISQSNYIPWIGYFDMINKVDLFVLYDEVQFTRRDWRNRNRIKTAQGLKWLSIPVIAKGRYTQKIAETRIADPSWASNHFRLLQQSYAQAPGYHLIHSYLENAFEQAGEMRLLSEVNHFFLRSLCEHLAISTPLRQSSEFELAEGRTERLLSICRQVGANTYLSGPAASNYLDVRAFEEAGVAVEWMDYSGYSEYPQLHGPFEQAVTILDLLFNTGEKARKFLGGAC